ncbi:MAG: hypothetical protein ABIR32_02450 [Ilumatobacteraceae bacterium]
MRFLRRTFRLYRPAEEAEPEPDEVVWVATVALWQAPLIVHGLREQRIRATFAESSARRWIVGGLPAARIYVEHRHRSGAERIITELTSRSDGT